MFNLKFGTKTHCPLSPCWAPFVFATRNTNGVILETNINCNGQSLFNSLNLGQSSMLFMSALAFSFST